MQERDQIRTIGSHFRSGRADLSADFFAPCLCACSIYKRAAGFFSSSALVSWASVLPKIAQGGGTAIQLLIAPILSEQDRESLGKVADSNDRHRFLQSIADRIVLETTDFQRAPDDQKLRLKLFAWMIASERLTLRFAFARHIEDAGIFHEKIGVFQFPWGDRIAFTGSANESRMGHSQNYETVDVFRSWVPEDAARVTVKSEQFEEAWNDKAPGLKVCGLSEEALKRVRLLAPDTEPRAQSQQSDGVEPTVARWRHQDEAIAAFLAKRRGVFEMATGTGKTRTALRICEKLLQTKKIDTVIIAADGTDLLDQWHAELLNLTARLPDALPIVRHYGTHHERDRFLLDPSKCILLVSRPALLPALRGLGKAEAARTLLIHDEVHRLGSVGNRTALAGLSDRIPYRLGLSATPEREYDSDGNVFIEQHIGPVVFTFGLDDAIRRGVLAPFNYFPIDYVPDENDRQRLANVYKLASARRLAGKPMSQEEVWIELAKVYKTSLAKLPLFETFIAGRQDLLERCIVFVETMEYGDQVLDILHKYRHDFHTYYSGEDSETLSRFARGELQCLLTCHRLSEGIDIQSLRTVILFSAARARLESIQRMGRCLRVDPANPLKRANVVDFIRQSPDADEGDEPRKDNADELRRDWLAALSKIGPEEGSL